MNRPNVRSIYTAWWPLAAYWLFMGIELPLIALAILAVSMTSHINLGVRHILPMYAPLAIVAALATVGAAALSGTRALGAWDRGLGCRPRSLHSPQPPVTSPRVSAIALAAWLIIGSLLAHPDYIPWFNAFAGKHPERILNDSNLDWGQDALRLVRTVRKMPIGEITTSIFSTADLDRVGLPPRKELQAFQPVSGWVAISEMNIMQGEAYSPELKKWIHDVFGAREYTRVGKTIRLYHLVF